MNRLSRFRRIPAARRRPCLEWLESRHLLSAGLIAAIQPANGERLVQSPQELVITLNQPLVPAIMGSFDVQLEHVNSDGTTTPVFDPNNPPTEESDATGTQLIIPLQDYNELY